MIIHSIQDTSSEHVIELLKSGLSRIEDDTIIKNYHPDYYNHTSNLFYILKNGRYRKGNYFVIEENNQYICSAGWNEYQDDPDIAFALTRMYVDKSHRGKYFIAKNILPKTLQETKNYSKVWLTVNPYNKLLYDWFVRASQGKSTGLVNNWPDIYRKFKPIGMQHIYSVDQYVMEYIG